MAGGPNRLSLLARRGLVLNLPGDDGDGDKKNPKKPDKNTGHYTHGAANNLATRLVTKLTVKPSLYNPEQKGAKGKSATFSPNPAQDGGRVTEQTFVSPGGTPGAPVPVAPPGVVPNALFAGGIEELAALADYPGGPEAFFQLQALEQDHVADAEMGVDDPLPDQGPATGESVASPYVPTLFGQYPGVDPNQAGPSGLVQAAQRLQFQRPGRQQSGSSNTSSDARGRVETDSGQHSPTGPKLKLPRRK